MANRYTQFTPQQYVESFVETPTMDFPFQETMQVEAYKKKKQEDLFGKIGAMSAPVKGGILTDNAGITERYNKRMTDAFQDLSGRIQSMPTAQATMELNRLATQFANDPERRMLDTDASYRDMVEKQRFTEGYGTSAIHAGLNPDTIERLRKGEIADITPQLYGFTTDPGKIPAFENPLSMIQPDIVKGYQLSEDGTYKVTEGDQSLTMDIVMQRSKPFLESLRNDDGTIRISENMDPTMSKYINFKKAMAKQSGEDYLHSDFVRDYQDVAALKLKLNTSENVSGGPKGQGKKGGSEKEEPFPFDNASRLAVKYTPISEIKTAEALIRDTGTDVLNGKIEDKGLYDFSVTDDSPEAMKQVAEIENKYYEDRLAFHTKGIDRTPIVIGGKTIQRDTTKEDIAARQRALEDMKRRKIISSAALEASFATGGIDPTKQFSKDNWKPEEINALKNWEPVKKVVTTNPLTYQKRTETLQNDPPKGFTNINGKLVPDRIASEYKAWDSKFREVLDQELNREWTTQGWVLAKEGINKEGKASLPDETRIITNAVSAIQSNGNPNMYIDGKQFGFNKEFLAGETPEGLEDFASPETTIEPHLIYYNNSDNKWYAASKFHRKDGDNIKVSDKVIDIDITESMSTIMRDMPQVQRQIHAEDLAADNLMAIPKNTTINVRGFGKDTEEQFGSLIVKHNADDTYSIYGKMTNPLTGRIEDIEQIKKSGQFNLITNNLDRESATRTVAAMALDRYRNTQDLSTVTNIVEPLGNLEERSYVNVIGEEAVIPLKSTMETIIGKESGGLGYDAMNQGSDNSFGDAPKNSGTATSILKKPLTEMTIAEVMKHQSLDKNDPNRIFAAGLFQITPSTMDSMMNNPATRERLGINPQMRYTPEVQEKLGIELIHRRLREALRGTGTPNYIYDTQGFYDKLFNKGYKTGNKEFGALTSEFRGLDKLSETEKKNVFNNILSYIEKNPNLNI